MGSLIENPTQKPGLSERPGFSPPPPTRALVRPPGASFFSALSSRGHHPDVSLALEQHAAYCRALEQAGLTVEALPPDERFPDSCFVQDTALVIRGRAILCRPGAPTRLGEERAVEDFFRGKGTNPKSLEFSRGVESQTWTLARIESPGTLEGGDVMLLPDRVLVGASDRSNESGVEQLRAILVPLGLPVSRVPVEGYLHLLSAATYLGRGLILAAENFAACPAFADFEVIPVPLEEAYAANVLALGGSIVMPAGFPQAQALLESRGFRVLPVPLGEFEKVDGGATCLSMVW